MLARRHPDRWGVTQKNVNRNVNKDGDDVAPTQTPVLVVPGIMDKDEWQKAADEYKKYQPTYEEPAEGAEMPDGSKVH